MQAKNKEARDFLKQLEKLDKLIENKNVEREYWKALATDTTANSEGERVKSSGNPQKMADAVCRYVDLEREIDAAIDSLIERRRKVLSYIEQLDVEEYNLLHKVYVQYIPLKEYSYNIDRSYSWGLYMHQKALRSLQQLLEEDEKRRREYQM